MQIKKKTAKREVIGKIINFVPNTLLKKTKINQIFCHQYKNKNNIYKY